MSTLREQLAEYLTMRRALGYHLQELEHLVGQFCDWLADQGKTTTFTTQDAVTWARLPADADHHWWGMRLGAVRTFAAYLAANGADVQVPPRGILPAGPCRAVPYIYTQADLGALLTACPNVFPHGFLAHTMTTVIGLLAATGMRIGEALRLTSPDIHPAEGVLRVREGKNGQERLVPLHPSMVHQLVVYRDLPARVRTRPEMDGPLFVSRYGTEYHRSTIELYFARVVAAAGLQPRWRAHPRLHDLRH